MSGFGAGFSRDMAALDRALARGTLSPSEFRDAMRKLGVPLKDDKEVFPQLRPLPLTPDPEGWADEFDMEVEPDE